MTETEIRIAVAESLGWRITFIGVTALVGTRKPSFYEPIPNYPQSLDACAEFESTLTDPVERLRYCETLTRIILSSGENLVYPVRFEIVTATPLQRCQAYLNVKGLWKTTQQPDQQPK